MIDIVERLRDKWMHSEEDCYKAADEIDRLRKVISIAIESIDADDVIAAYEKLAKAKETWG